MARNLKSRALGAALIISGQLALALPIDASPRHPSLRKNSVDKRVTISPAKRLAEELFLNSVGSSNTNLAQDCKVASGKRLLLALDDVVKGWNSEKGEFETTEAFNVRLAERAAILNNNRDTIVCWSLAEDSAFVRYDADKQEFAVDSFRVTHIGSDSRDTGSYVSSTAMGAKARVYRSVGIDYEIDPGVPYLSVMQALGCAKESLGNAHFYIPVAEAPRIKASGYLVAVGVFAPPFESRSISDSQPTLSDPFDTHTLTLKLHMNINSVFLVGADGRRYSCTVSK